MGEGTMPDQQLRLFAEVVSPSQKLRHFASKEKILGQFFTPKAIARFMVAWAELLGIPKGIAIDPACGDGVFLKELVAAGFEHILGVDIDDGILRKLANQVPAAVELRQADGLMTSQEGFADFVVGNPPFSAKYGRVKDRSILNCFALGKGRRSQAPEVLFLEKFVRLAKPGGLIAIILPEGVFASLPMQPVRDYIASHLLPLAVISLSRRFFPAKTSILIARKELYGRASDWPVFLGTAEDEAGLNKLLELYRAGQEGDSALFRPLRRLRANMSVEFHLPMPDVLSEIDPSIPLVPLSRLLKSLRTGRTEYGPGREFVPSGFRWIGASVVTPLGLDFRKEERFIRPGSPMDKRTAYTQVGDVLFVRVGVGCAGRVAAVLSEEECGIADDYIYILRLNEEEILPEYFALFAATRFFKAQIERLKRGVGTVNIPQSALKTVRVAVPLLSVQERFASLYRQLHYCCPSASTKGTYREVLASFDAAVAELEALLEGGKTCGRASPSCVG
ncbi:MAG: N-6 DNA methylase [Candidatus Acetothermia bacterium]|jgi:type I restriction enzyme M protein|nr:N-6 DNA methylase [Candidatus Acetothermia bacterium]MDH7504624.1 N-6 DNA methylase [Candidatus Acetothermia bacterium]